MEAEKETPWRVLLASSFLFYAITAPLLSRYVSSSGIFGILYAIPLAAVTWWRGRRAGVTAAVAGVVLNEGLRVWFHGPGGMTDPARAPETAAAVLLQGSALVVFALAIARIRELRGRYERSEELRMRSESNYLGLIQLAPEGAAVVQDQRVVFCNDHLLSMFGYGKDEVLGTSFQLLLHEEEREMATRLHARRLNGEPANAGEVRYVCKSTETRWMNYVGARVEWNGRPAALYLVSDITAKKALEQQWRQAQKMEAIGRLAGAVAHDFNNTLQVILGTCESLADHATDAAEVRADTALVRQAATSAAALTRQLLLFSRAQAGQPRVVDVGSVLQRWQKMIECALGEEIALTIVRDDEPAFIRAEESRIQQVIMNLAVNARDAMPHGGVFGIHVGRERIAGSLGAPPRGPAGGDYVTVRVTDTGCGMSAHTLEHVFEPFFTTKEAPRGTGLGLWIVHSVMAQSGGLVSVDSEPGRGTTFTLRFPQAGRPDELARAAEEPPAAADRGTRHAPQGPARSVLLVEDEEAVRKLVKSLLERNGCSVTAAADGASALEACRGHGGRLDLLITDLGMPGMRGEVLAELVTERHPETRVILMTGHHERFTDRADATDGRTILLKPFLAEQLLSAIRRALE